MLCVGSTQSILDNTIKWSKHTDKAAKKLLELLFCTMTGNSDEVGEKISPRGYRKTSSISYNFMYFYSFINQIVTFLKSSLTCFSGKHLCFEFLGFCVMATAKLHFLFGINKVSIYLSIYLSPGRLWKQLSLRCCEHWRKTFSVLTKHCTSGPEQSSW